MIKYISITNIEDLWRTAWEALGKLLVQNRDRKTLLLLSGGSAIKLYGLISKFQLPISNLVVGQVDERFRPENPVKDQRSNIKDQSRNENINAYQIEKTGLWEWCGKNKIPYYLISQEGSLKKVAEEYDRTMEKLFRECDYKIAILGIGEDGHTAGLLPGYSELWVIKKYVVGYNLKSKIKNQNSKPQIKTFKPATFKQRISLTPFALKQLDRAVVVASGEKKREALTQVQSSKFKVQKHYEMTKELDKIPALLLHEISKVEVFTDQKIDYSGS